MKPDDFIAYTDGSCLKNPGPGGWGAILAVDGETAEMSGSNPATTNNVMEMTAVLETLKILPPEARGAIHSDSQYVIKGITEWRKGWEKKAFQNVKNAEIWVKLFEQVDLHPNVRFKWVKGHAGNEMNEAVDVIARTAAQRQS